MGGSSEWHVELISLQHTHPLTNKISMSARLQYPDRSGSMCVVSYQDAIKLYWDAL